MAELARDRHMRKMDERAKTVRAQGAYRIKRGLGVNKPHVYRSGIWLIGINAEHLGPGHQDRLRVLFAGDTVPEITKQAVDRLENLTANRLDEAKFYPVEAS